MTTPIGVLFQNPLVKPLSSNATFMSACTATFYKTGTTTPATIYADGTLTTPLANPLTADASGTFPAVYLDPTVIYRVILKTSAGVLVSDTDPYVPSSLSSLSANVIGGFLYPVVAAETALSIVPVSLQYPPAHAYRYGTNTTPGSTDMTSAVTTALTVGRTGGFVVQIPQTEVLFTTSTVDFSGCHVVGLGNPWNGKGWIQASSAQFDVIKSTGLMIIENLNVDGGWDGVTSGQSGDILSLKATSPAHPYLNSLSNCNFTNAKMRGVYIERGGYTSFSHMHVVQCGLHALECFGLNTDACTSIRDTGGSQFGGTKFGYGIKLTECAAMIFQGTIIETTNGIQLNGLDNRTIVFDGIYQEFNPSPSFTASITGTTLTVTAPSTLVGIGIGSVLTGSGIAANTVITAPLTGNGGIGTYTVNNSQSVASETMTSAPLVFNDNNSAGLGLSIRGMFGGNGSFPFAPGVASFPSWSSVYFSGNSNVTEGPIPLGGRIQSNVGGQGTISASGDVTVAQLTLTPGTYRLSAAVQTIAASGSGTATQLACQITTNSSATSPANSTSSFVEGAAQTQSFGATNQDARISCSTIVQVFATTIYYVRAHIGLTGTITEAYNGSLRAELIE